MDTCIVCGKKVHIDDGYVTDGKIFVCRDCAETQTLRTITVYIAYDSLDSNLVYKREKPIEAESGLVNQTDEAELDKAYIDERDGFPLPNGCSKNCPYYPYDTCGHYYGEIHECMLEEEETEADIETESSLVDQTASPSVPKAEIVLTEEYEGEIEADIENMSEEDFLSKYCDDGYAIGKWYDAHTDDTTLTSI